MGTELADLSPSERKMNHKTMKTQKTVQQLKSYIVKREDAKHCCHNFSEMRCIKFKAPMFFFSNI